MPGHKGRGDGAFASLLPYDITEVSGADSLYHADGAILALERRLAALYGAKRSLLCAGGATLCIQTMLALACGIGKKVIMSRNLHRSAINAVTLLDLSPRFIYPDGSAGAWFCGRYTPEAVRDALTETPDAAALYITSPDYFGVVSDLAGIAAVCKEFSVPLLVDNAHGAHFSFLAPERACPHPMDCGAALCADSLHKTMPAMTGGAALHIGAVRYAADAKRIMSLFGSTSPSYPILLSCETAVTYAQKGARAGFARTAEHFDRLREIALQRGLSLPAGATDPAKLSLCFGARGMIADVFDENLRAHSVEPEYTSATACVLMGNDFNAAADYARLENALRDLPPPAAPVAALRPLPRPPRVLSPRAAAFSTQETAAVENAMGRVAAAEISPCPPGIPIVMPGERIDRATLDALENAGVTRVTVVAEEAKVTADKGSHEEKLCPPRQM